MNTFSRNVQVKCINHHLQKLSTYHMIHKNQKLLKKRIFSWSVVVYHGQQRTSQAIAKEQAIPISAATPTAKLGCLNHIPVCTIFQFYLHDLGSWWRLQKPTLKIMSKQEPGIIHQLTYTNPSPALLRIPLPCVLLNCRACGCQAVYPKVGKRVVNNYISSLEADGGYHGKQCCFERKYGRCCLEAKAHSGRQQSWSQQSRRI